jgi:hypothetical protein
VGHPACLPADDASRVLRQFHEHITTQWCSLAK